LHGRRKHPNGIFIFLSGLDDKIREAFSGRTLDVPQITDDCSKEIRIESRQKYAAPRKAVEENLKKWDESASAPPAEDEMGAEEKFEEPLI